MSSVPNSQTFAQIFFIHEKSKNKECITGFRNFRTPEKGFTDLGEKVKYLLPPKEQEKRELIRMTLKVTPLPQCHFPRGMRSSSSGTEELRTASAALLPLSIAVDTPPKNSDENAW